MSNFSNELNELGREAFESLKDAMHKAGVEEVIIKNPFCHLYVDPCGEYPELYSFLPHRVAVEDGIVVIEEDKYDGDDDARYDPSRFWCEGGMSYAEWEGLLTIIDLTINKLECINFKQD